MKKILIVGLVFIVAFVIFKQPPGAKSTEKKYKNLRYGYSFKYPATWSLDVIGDNYIAVNRAHRDKEIASMNRSVTSVVIEAIENPKNLGLQVIYLQKNSEGDKWLARAGAPTKIFEQTTFAGKPALKVTTPGLSNSDYYLDDGRGSVLSVALEINGDEADKEFLNEGRAVLESFTLS